MLISSRCFYFRKFLQAFISCSWRPKSELNNKRNSQIQAAARKHENLLHALDLVIS